MNPWTHPQILRPAGVRNLDLSAPKSSKSGPPQQSLPDVLRNLLRNQSEPLDSSTDTTTRGGPEFGPFSPEKAQKADPRNKASQTFCGTFSGTKVNPWTHPRILRPAGVRNLDLSAPKSSKSGPPQQSLADVLRNLLRNQSEPLESSTDTTTRGGPEFGPFSPEKLKKRTPQVDKQPAPRTQTSASALTGRGCQCAVLNVLLFQPPLRALPQSLLGQERISGHVRPWLAPPPPPILLSSHLPEDCI